MKKELIIIFENLTLEDVPTAVKEETITSINADGTKFNSFLITVLKMLTEAIDELEKEKSVIASSTIDVILAFEFTAKNVTLLIEQEEESFKLVPSELESININCKSILNAVGRIKELQTNNIKKLNPEEMLAVLTT